MTVDNASENAATENAASENDAPTLRQKLHAATGDREAEAKALADRADDVDEDAALDAVRKAHGDLGPGQPGPESDLATRADAKVADQD